MISWRSMTKIKVSISQGHGSADPDPDPHQNVMDPQHCCKENPICVLPRKKLCSLAVPISTFMYLWAIYIFPRSVHIFPAAQLADQFGECLIFRNICFGTLSLQCVSLMVSCSITLSASRLFIGQLLCHVTALCWSGDKSAEVSQPGGRDPSHRLERLQLLLRRPPQIQEQVTADLSVSRLVDWLIRR